MNVNKYYFLTKYHLNFKILKHNFFFLQRNYRFQNLLSISRKAKKNKNSFRFLNAEYQSNTTNKNNI